MRCVRCRTHPKTDLSSSACRCAIAGNAYLEYFVLASVVLLATIVFLNGGFRGTQNTLDDVFNNLASQVAPP